MTIALPDRDVEPRPGELTAPDALTRVWRGVQQNFAFLSSMFPLGQLFTASDGTLQSSLTGLVFAEFPQVRLTRSTDTGNIANGAWTAISFDTEEFDKGTPTGMHDGTNPTRITCQVPGLYVLTTNITWDANATGSRGARINLNAASILAEVEAHANVVTNFTQLNVTTIQRLVVGDYVEVEAQQTSGGGLPVIRNVPGTCSTNFAGAWLSV